MEKILSSFRGKFMKMIRDACINLMIIQFRQILKL